MSSQLTKYSDLKVGQKASLEKRITEDDFSNFIAIDPEKELVEIKMAKK